MRVPVDVIGQNLIAHTKTTYVTGTREFIKFAFNLDNDWDKLTTFAQFTQNGTSYNRFLDDENTACLPPEITTGICSLMLYGTRDTTIGISSPLILKIVKNVFSDESGEIQITPTLYEQLADLVNEYKTIVDSYQSTTSEQFSSINNKIGNLQSLNTDNKNDLVSAVNEVLSGISNLQSSINNKQNILTFDNAPRVGSSNPVTSDGIYKALQNIKTSSEISTTDDGNGNVTILLT